MKVIAEKKALERLSDLRTDYAKQIRDRYEHKAASCLTCQTPGACCLDAHFVNVHISRLEAAAIRHVMASLAEEKQAEVYRRIEETVERYGLERRAETFTTTFACPLFEKGTGCLVHETAKPVPCTTHACYESAADLPPDEIQMAQEERIDQLNQKTYGKPQPWLPLPVALIRYR
ncbi:hypothetical protein BH10ACI2_BH10ACI2_08230 [soil metagenome]